MSIRHTIIGRKFFFYYCSLCFKYVPTWKLKDLEQTLPDQVDFNYLLYQYSADSDGKRWCITTLYFSAIFILLCTLRTSLALFLFSIMSQVCLRAPSSAHYYLSLLMISPRIWYRKQKMFLTILSYFWRNVWQHCLLMIPQLRSKLDASRSFKSCVWLWYRAFFSGA